MQRGSATRCVARGAFRRVELHDRWPQGQRSRRAPKDERRAALRRPAAGHTDGRVRGPGLAARARAPRTRGASSPTEECSDWATSAPSMCVRARGLRRPRQARRNVTWIVGARGRVGQSADHLVHDREAKDQGLREEVGGQPKKSVEAAAAGAGERGTTSFSPFERTTARPQNTLSKALSTHSSNFFIADLARALARDGSFYSASRLQRRV